MVCVEPKIICSIENQIMLFFQNGKKQIVELIGNNFRDIASHQRVEPKNIHVLEYFLCFRIVPLGDKFGEPFLGDLHVFL